ncbi:MAG: Cupin 2 conserved barrel domain protein [Alphaproteobacteria bacterium]|nr:Cupin 2 conserved barrel domain protein [Alphaproteobacteria bacterium]
MTQSPNALELVCADFKAALDLLRRLGMRLDVIYPADDPHDAILTQDGISVRLTSRPDAPPPSDGLPAFRPEFVVTHAGTASGEGRAGMHYRDLIPSRLGGRYIASHIAIAEGGPVADWVHFHRIAVQLICVRKGWVRVVYEDQGAPFVMAAGDMVLQPPGIRHRVLESSPGLEVVEITCPALHETFADHDMALPNGEAGPARLFGGQHFLHHVAANAPWIAWHGAEAQVTGVRDATGGIAEARILRRGVLPVIAMPAHDGELVFGFVLEGSVRLDHCGDHPLGPADSFVIPPGEAWNMSEMSRDFRLLLVTTGSLG